MKEVKKIESVQEESLFEQAVKQPPAFSSDDEAIDSYTKKLNALAERRGTTVQELLLEAENSSKFEEDFLEVRQIWMTLSALRKK